MYFEDLQSKNTRPQLRFRSLSGADLAGFGPFPHFVESSPFRKALKPSQTGQGPFQLSTKWILLSRVEGGRRFATSVNRDIVSAAPAFGSTGWALCVKVDRRRRFYPQRWA